MFELQKTYIPSKQRSTTTTTMAMPLRLVTSFLLIFFVIAVWLLNAHDSHHAGGNTLADGNKPFFTQEGLGVAATAASDNRPKARKMIVEKLVKMMVLEKRNVGGAAASEKEGGSSTRRESYKYGKKKEVVVDWSEEGQKRDGRSLLSEEINVGTFVAFNEDYHGPRHHPPKNN